MEQTDVYATRFKDAVWYKPFGHPLNVFVGGVGGIGSWLALLLSRMGHIVRVADHDYVEEHNLGGQLYRNSSVGHLKVLETTDVCRSFSPDCIIEPYDVRIDEENVDNIVEAVSFLAFDNMYTRRIISEAWFNAIIAKRRTGHARRTDINLLIDGRMEAETAIIYCINSISRFERYTDELFTDEEVPDNSCTFRATSHNPAIMAGYMVAAMNNHISNKVLGENFREVPFKIEYELPTFTYTTIR